jgi:predicted RNA-binding Zn-ribbon protein involved in translation (DUF1610 family)
VPISVKCPSCGKGLSAPDAMAGKEAKCPACGQPVPITPPEQVLDAEFVEPAAPAEPAGLGNLADLNQPALPDAAAGDGERRPCPACGEMIAASAAKCRFCGEIFDPALKRAESKKSGSADDDLTTGDWVLAILCSGIGCLMGIIWLIQGKKKAGKMIGISLLAGFLIRVAMTILASLAKH